MERMDPLPLSVLDSCIKYNELEVNSIYQEELKSFDRKIIVLDDDPTGTQTVHDIPVYTDWTAESLMEGLSGEESMFFVLTNSRSFPVQKTRQEHKILAERAAKAAKEKGKKFLLISRGDSTLRGHYPLELEVLKDTLEENLGVTYSGQIICPYFREGGRFTIDSVHYVREGDWLIPAGRTEFARDKTFGYQSSHLGDYAQEKSGGRYSREDCIYITLEFLREQKYEEITELLMKAVRFAPVIVDATNECDVMVFSICLLRAIKAGKEFLIRSAAAVPKVLGNVKSKPLLTKNELVGKLEEENKTYGGIVLIGSHVKKTTSQLESLQTTKVPIEFFEFDVNVCFVKNGLMRETERLICEAERVMAQGKTAVVYTSRTLLAPPLATKEELLSLSVSISDAVTGVIAGLHKKPGFLIAKGGITSSDVGTKALRVKKAMVLGQVQPGIPVWKTGEESKFPGLSYIIFPGNVGEVDTLKKIVELLGR